MDVLDRVLVEGSRCLEEGRLGEAAAMFQKVLAHRPGHPGALNNLANVLQAAGRHGEANSIRLELIDSVPPPLVWRIASNYLVGLQYQMGDEPNLLAEASRIGQMLGTQRRERLTGSGSSRLRVGFISGDLCDHPVGLFLLPLIQNLHDTILDPVLFSTESRDHVTSGILRSLAEWHDVSHLQADELEALLLRHRLDVMIDLSGHTPGNRLPVLARRVAPVQVSWLGYFATTGVPAVDYVLMDPWHAPVGSDVCYTERVLRMPHNRFCYQAPAFAPDVAPPPSELVGHVAFGSFNNTAKYNPQVFSTWAGILHGVPNSRLILKWRTFVDPTFRDATIRHFQALGISPERIELRNASGHRQLLDEYSDIDIALDPFPFSGGHTSCEALWMGVPVLTFPGERAVSRQTLSFIANLQQSQWLDQWVANGTIDYVRKGIALAANSGERALIRASLRSAMRSSHLMNAQRFALAFEQAITEAAMATARR